MGNIEEEKLEYINIQIIKSEISNDKGNPLQRGDNFQLDYKVDIKHFYNLDKKLIRIILDVEIVALRDNERLNAGAKFEIDNYFHYPDLDKIAEKDGDKVLIGFYSIGLLKGLAYSTARGIIHSKLAGTFLENTILPVKMSTNV
jgi:hypothetical protein